MRLKKVQNDYKKVQYDYKKVKDDYKFAGPAARVHECNISVIKTLSIPFSA